MNRCAGNVRVLMSALLGLLLIEVAAFAGFAPWGDEPNNVIRLDPNEMLRLPKEWEDRVGLERYEKEGAEVVPWTQETALPSPDNAALLYYQAFLLRPQPDEATYLRINAVLRGALPDDSVRSYLGHCRKAIHMVEVASLTPQCTWGIRHLDIAGFREMDLLGQVHQLAFVLAVDARTLGADGRYDAAFARCLTMCRMARHVGDDTMFAYLVFRTIDEMASRAMQHVLGLVPSDAETFLRLRGQIAVLPGSSQSFKPAAQADLNLQLERLRHKTLFIDSVRQELADVAESRQTKDEILRLTNDEILALIRESSERFLHGLFQIMDSDMPYEQKYAEIDGQLTAARLQPSVITGVTLERWNLLVRDTAMYNALVVALDVYMIRAQTGRLPETLPAYARQDPFSGQTFEYEITTGGFVLRCRVKDLYQNRIWQYEFNARD